MNEHFLSVTELANTEVSAEQIHRLCSRYYWVSRYCNNKKVLELACGTGQGLSYIASVSESLNAGDICSQMVEIAKAHHEDLKHNIDVLDGMSLSFENASFDVIILLEALYYLKDFEGFITEAKRVLKPNGKLLLASANPDLYDFNPSPFSQKYYGVMELQALFKKNGFSTAFFGDFPIQASSLKQKLLRPIKKMVVALGFMPKTMAGKKLLKRLVFGKLVLMPAKITQQLVNNFSYCYDAISGNEANRSHKVILCEATKN